MGKARILIVDDDRPTVMIISSVLKKHGYDVFTAFNGISGLRKAQEEKPHLIILDIVMPGIDGIETLRRIKEKFPDLYVVIISAYGTIETSVKAIKYGAFDFIEKPLEMSYLLEKVNSILSVEES